MRRVAFTHICRGTSQPRHGLAVMSDAAYYRGEALRFLHFAKTARDTAVRRRWQRLADDYVTLAAQLDAERYRTPFLRFSEPQPVQQPQSKLQGTGDGS